MKYTKVYGVKKGGENNMKEPKKHFVVTYPATTFALDGQRGYYFAEKSLMEAYKYTGFIKAFKQYDSAFTARSWVKEANKSLAI